MLEELNKLTSSEIFKKFKDSNKDSYLSSCFTIIVDEKKPVWQFHYYDKKEDKITTFKVDNKIKKISNSEIFKKESDEVEELKIEKVKFQYEQALEKIELMEKYKEQEFNKKIIILQKINKPIWNISLLTETFNILNVKFSAESGEILKETFESLLSFKQ